MKNKWLRVLAVLGLILAITFALFQSTKAINLARQVDYRGDIRSCQQENAIRREANDRNAELEKTAKLLAESLAILRQVDRGPGETTNDQLREVSIKARKLQTNFKPARIADCRNEVPSP
jgi:hypothetical protein